MLKLDELKHKMRVWITPPPLTLLFHTRQKCVMFVVAR